MSTSLSPIVLFTYQRLEHTKKTIAALQENTLARDSDLIIYSDAPKSPTATASVASVRSYLSTITGFASVTIIERERNLGLATSIVDGVSSVLSKYDSVIVLEDDIVTSPHFLTYMNETLTLYKNTPEVMHVSGYYFPTTDATDLPDTFFYNQTSCWGWGTWARAWEYYQSDASSLLNTITTSGRLREFDMDGNFRFSSTLRANINGSMNTWAIKWHASVFIHNGLCLHPKFSLTHNSGHDGSGEHGQVNPLYRDPNFSIAKPVTITIQPLVESRVARTHAIAFLSQLRPSFMSRLKNLLNL